MIPTMRIGPSLLVTGRSDLVLIMTTMVLIIMAIIRIRQPGHWWQGWWSQVSGGWGPAKHDSRQRPPSPAKQNCNKGGIIVITITVVVIVPSTITQRCCFHFHISRFWVIQWSRRSSSDGGSELVQFSSSRSFSIFFSSCSSRGGEGLYKWPFVIWLPWD